MKTCGKCRIGKPAGGFQKDKRAPSGLQSICKDCRKAQAAARVPVWPAEGKKECKRCGQTKALDRFHVARRNMMGVAAHCKSCGAAAYRARSTVPPRKARISADGMKPCVVCEEVKALKAYSPQRRGLYGVRAICKLCAAKAASEATAAHEGAGRPLLTDKRCGRCGEVKLISEFNRGTGPTGFSSYCRACAKEQKAKWIAEDPEAYRLMGCLSSVKRRTRVLNATPAWLNAAHLAEIEGFYFFCRLFPGHHVDHIVPLQGKNVCGLHAPNNMQILTADANFRKNNRHA